MGRSYAGILGLLAFATTVARGVLHQSSISSAMLVAAGCMFAFAGLGYVLGNIAEATIAEALKARFAAEMERLSAEAGTNSTSR